VGINQIAGISTTGAQDGFTLIFNSDTGSFEANTISVKAVNGGDF
jgi:hypothetical protein